MASDPVSARIAAGAADQMRLWLYDESAGILKRVQRGAANSGGPNKRLPVIDN